MILPKNIVFQCTPEQAKDNDYLQTFIANLLGVKSDSFRFVWQKRSLDARKKQLKINASVSVYPVDDTSCEKSFSFPFQNVSSAKEVHIIGAGPAGLYAALRAIEKGLKPIVFERGKDVRARRRDLAILNKEHKVNPESNYCFGEGGAGTYSDGKLYTRSKKRGDVKRAMEWLVAFGAHPDILVDAHPHIGTNKLPALIQNIRNEIIRAGGEVLFNAKLSDLVIENNRLVGIELNHEKQVAISHLILATGHSARDIFHLLHRKGIEIQAKPFALGVRVEHSQSFIDKLQYHGRLSDEFVPPSSYALVEQVDGRGVYSFCMCPGGVIAPCATDRQEVVTNGWSPSKRNNPYANSGMVVSVYPEDFPGYESNPLVCLEFQQEVERLCWEAAGKSQCIPAQGMADFVNEVRSTEFPRSSYHPGIVSVELNKLLPSFISDRLRKAFKQFDKKMPGFLTNDAVVHAPESRTSSPVQIPRDKDTFEHVTLKGLYPCAEGAGYAGGIISAAIDGMRCIDAIWNDIEKESQA